jgi:hypothetical protein
MAYRADGRDLHVSVLRHATDREPLNVVSPAGIDAHCASTHGQMGFQRNSGLPQAQADPLNSNRHTPVICRWLLAVVLTHLFFEGQDAKELTFYRCDVCGRRRYQRSGCR